LGERLLSFTDCTSLALMEKHGIESIASFDSSFDGLVKRIA
jgi:predicted nucleic acid-binding protein